MPQTHPEAPDPLRCVWLHLGCQHKGFGGDSRLDNMLNKHANPTEKSKKPPCTFAPKDKGKRDQDILEFTRQHAKYPERVGGKGGGMLKESNVKVGVGVSKQRAICLLENCGKNEFKSGLGVGGKNVVFARPAPDAGQGLLIPDAGQGDDVEESQLCKTGWHRVIDSDPADAWAVHHASALGDEADVVAALTAVGVGYGSANAKTFSSAEDVPLCARSSWVYWGQRDLERWGFLADGGETAEQREKVIADVIKIIDEKLATRPMIQVWIEIMIARPGDKQPMIVALRHFCLVYYGREDVNPSELVFPERARSWGELMEPLIAALVARVVYTSDPAQVAEGPADCTDVMEIVFELTSKSAIGKGKAKFVDEMHLDLWMRGPLEQRLEAHKRCTDQDTANLIVSMRLLADWDTLTDHGMLDKKQDDPALTARGLWDEDPDESEEEQQKEEEQDQEAEDSDSGSDSGSDSDPGRKRDTSIERRMQRDRDRDASGAVIGRDRSNVEFRDKTRQKLTRKKLLRRRNFQSFIKLEHYVRKGLLGSSLIELKVSQTNIEIDSRRDDNERARREGNRVQSSVSGLTFDRGGQDRHYDMSAALNIERGRGLLHCGSGFSVLAVNAGGDYKGVINSMPSARTQSPDNVLKLGGARLIERLDSRPTAWVEGIREGPFASCWVGGRLEQSATAGSTAPDDAMDGAEGEGPRDAARALRVEKRRAEQAEREMAQAKASRDHYKERAEAAEARIAAEVPMEQEQENATAGEQEELATLRTLCRKLNLRLAHAQVNARAEQIAAAHAELARLEAAQEQQRDLLAAQKRAAEQHVSGVVRENAPPAPTGPIWF